METQNTIRTSTIKVTSPLNFKPCIEGLKLQGRDRGSLGFLGREKSGEFFLDVIEGETGVRAGEKRMLAPASKRSDVRHVRAIYAANDSYLFVADEGYFAGKNEVETCKAIAGILKAGETNVLFGRNPRETHKEEAFLLSKGHTSPSSLTKAGYKNPVLTANGTLLAIRNGGLVALSPENVAKGNFTTEAWRQVTITGAEGTVTSLNPRIVNVGGKAMMTAIIGNAFVSLNLDGLSKGTVAAMNRTALQGEPKAEVIGTTADTTFVIAEPNVQGQGWTNSYVVPAPGSSIANSLASA